MASFREIQAQIEQLQRQAAEERKSELDNAFRQIRQLMDEYDISVDDLQSTRKRSAPKKFGPVQFRNAQTGDTWSGRGRMPNWLAGQDKEQYRV